jgi:FtsP/CotA-like multicopper oxidase with cupredoxin domain
VARDLDFQRNSLHLSRRAALLGGGAATLLAITPAAAAAKRVVEMTLTAGPAVWPVRGPATTGTSVWSYGTVPGPVIRARQGDRLRITVENRLSESTTVHWHGIRLPNAMDGVPGLTQRPISPGGRFRYKFDLPDAGTFWYHPHDRSYVQVARGLYGALIVEEATPYVVDREVTWVLSDWRLDANGVLVEDFGNESDVMHDGRIGNYVTINGGTPQPLILAPGERVRLRLINAASARTFALSFEGHRPWVIALDGQPVAPHEPEGGRIVLASASRADIILDGIGEPGRAYRVVDDFYERGVYAINALGYAQGPRSAAAPSPPPSLPGNPLAEPNLKGAKRVEMVFRGGMEGNEISGHMRHGPWTIDGITPKVHGQGHGHDTHHLAPFLTVKRGQTVVFAMRNETDWHHPMHVHGHSFLVVSRNGAPVPRKEWRDTVLLAPRQAAEIAFVADNPGSWMVHCHVLDHQDNGMMAVFRVA